MIVPLAHPEHQLAATEQVESESLDATEQVQSESIEDQGTPPRRWWFCGLLALIGLLGSAGILKRSKRLLTLTGCVGLILPAGFLAYGDTRPSREDAGSAVALHSSAYKPHEPRLPSAPVEDLELAGGKLSATSTN